MHLPAIAPRPPNVCRSQKTLDAVQHALSAAPDAVSYSVTRAMTLAAPIRSLNAAAPAAIGNSSLKICDARKRPVLAPEDESRAMAALRFSLASDIVELVVLTADEAFLQTLARGRGSCAPALARPVLGQGQRPAGGGRRRHPGARRAGAATRLPRGSSREIKRQFPDLVIVVAGNREAETELARLISDGIDLSIHPQAHVARAGAAVRRRSGQALRRSAAPDRPRSRSRRPGRRVSRAAC